MDDLELAFHRACLEAIDHSRALGYDPSAWAAMVEQHGAVKAARRLLADATVQSGFARLCSMNEPELTVEWAVLESRWGPLFHDSHREAADWRLTEAGVRRRPA